MRQAEQDRLKAEIDSYIANGTTTMAPEEYRNPVSAYGGRAQYEGEMALIRSVPIVIAHESELPNPGDFVANSDAGVPVLVVRQADGSVRAMVNLCRHRGAQVVMEPSGCERRFTCPYHAWSYKLDGSLAAVPNSDGFPTLDKSEHGLVELACEVRHGMVWVVLTPGLPIDVAAHLGAELDDELAAFGLDTYQVERSVGQLEEQCNWKLIVDGFLETYHLRFLHAATVGPYIRSNCGPYKEFGLHGRMVIVRSRYDSEKSVGERFLRDIGAVYRIFPNTVLVWQGTHFERWSILPKDGPDRCTTYASILAPKGQVTDVGMWDTNWKILLSTVQNEDWPVAVATQAGLAANAQQTFLFGRNEPGLQHFHQSVRDMIAELAGSPA